MKSVHAVIHSGRFESPGDFGQASNLNDQYFMLAFTQAPGRALAVGRRDGWVLE